MYMCDPLKQFKSKPQRICIKISRTHLFFFKEQNSKDYWIVLKLVIFNLDLLILKKIRYWTSSYARLSKTVTCQFYHAICFLRIFMCVFLISSLFGALSLCRALFLSLQPFNLLLLICIWQTSSWTNFNVFCCTFPLISNHIKIVLLALEPKSRLLIISYLILNCLVSVHLSLHSSIYIVHYLSLTPSIYLSFCVGSKVPV